MTGTKTLTRVLAVCGVLLLLTACSPQAGGGTEPSDGASQGADESTDTSSDADESDDDSKPLDPCNLIPDDALTAALGSPPLPDRTEYPGSGSTTCVIEGSGGSSRLSIEVALGGLDQFELFRSYKEPLEDYQTLTGIGEDAFGFGSEVTVLAGDKVAVLFLDGLYFDDVPAADRLERTKTLAVLAAESLG